MKKYGDLRKKISGRRGAALMIALLVFFLAALSGTVALTMAASNAGRYTHEKDDQQAYLSVVSAANIILDRLTGIEIVCEAPGGNPEPEQVTVSISKGKDDLFLNDAGFDEILKFYSANKGSAPTLEFTLTADDAPAMGKVYVNLSLNGGTFFFRLYSEDSGHRDYQMTLRVSTEFTSGTNNFTKEETDSGIIYIRKMYFDTESATYTVEENVPSGGTEG